MKQIIKQLEEEKNKLDLKIIKINQAIQTLKGLDEEEIAPISSEKVKTLVHHNELEDIRKNLLKKTKKEVIYSNDKRLKPISQHKPKQQKYLDEMELFIENHMNGITNQELCDLINHNYHVGINTPRLAAYMQYKKLRRNDKTGRKKMWTDEIIQFLRDNRNKYSNKEFCVELEKKFNIKTNPDTLSGVFGLNKIKKDYTTGFDKEIFDFVLNSKITDVLLLRDEIIEKFSKDIAIGELRKMISERTEKSKIESVHSEVKRISKDQGFDDELDAMELDR